MTVLQDIISPQVQYDEHVKRLLSDRYILAWILKCTTAEFAELSIEQIAKECIVEDIEISQRQLMPGERIIGNNTEDAVPLEGTIFFDIRFSAYIPPLREAVKILVNVEAQKNFYLKYPIVTRGVFYGARMISAQLNTEFQADDYSGMKKVYSIWICMNAPDYVGNAISHYYITKEDILPGIPDEKETYDKLSIVMVCLNGTKEGQEKGDGVVGLLNTLLSTDIKMEEKVRTLKEKYKIPIRDAIGKEMEHMCNLGEGIWEQALEKGMKLGIEQGIEQETRRIVINMLNNNLTTEDICSLTRCNVTFVEKVRASL